MNELLTRLYHDLYDVETVTLRYFNVYGPNQTGGDDAGVIDVFADQAQNGNPMTVQGEGTQPRDFVHVNNVLRANRLSARTERVGHGYNVGTGKAVTICDPAERIRESVDSDSQVVHTPARDGDIRHSRADISRARTRLKYDIIVGLDACLKPPCLSRQTPDSERTHTQRSVARQTVQRRQPPAWIIPHTGEPFLS
jgi:UDP-glucose 4-epimerase